jgi:hypothetical protein
MVMKARPALTKYRQPVSHAKLSYPITLYWACRITDTEDGELRLFSFLVRPPGALIEILTGLGRREVVRRSQQ